MWLNVVIPFGLVLNYALDYLERESEREREAEVVWKKVGSLTCLSMAVWESFMVFFWLMGVPSYYSTLCLLARGLKLSRRHS